MGTYIQSGEEIKEDFEKFLQGTGEGDITAETIAEAWNSISKKQKWGDRLIAVTNEDLKARKEEIKDLKRAFNKSRKERRLI
jgi:hypothetical protein